MNNTLSDIKGINQFFDSIFKELKIDNQKQLNDAFIQKLSILVEKPIAEVQKDALNTQMLLMEKIQKTTQIFQDALNNNDTADNSIVEEEIYAWKQRLEALGINEGFESISEQVQNLLKATKEQNLKALGNSFEQLATYFEAENIGNNDTLVEELKKNLPLQYFEQISKHLKHNNSSIINQTLKQVAQKFKEEEDNINLDEVVNIFERNLGHFFDTEKEKREAQKIEEYHTAARNSIAKSLKAHDIKPFDNS